MDLNYLHADIIEESRLSKFVAAVGMLTAIGLGVPTIAKMLNTTPDRVEAAKAASPEPTPQVQEPAEEEPVEATRITQEQTFLARIIFAEASNQSLQAKRAVAQVIMNRVGHRRYPNNTHGVITQRYQFSAYPDSRLWGISNNPAAMNVMQRRAWDESIEVAGEALNDELPNVIGNATLYHDNSIDLDDTGWNPDVIEHVGSIGDFQFYSES